MWDAMQNATKKVITSICGKEIEKLLAIAKPFNGVDFLDEVSLW